jgi:hypothetical protein
MSEHAVIVRFQYGEKSLDALQELERDLEIALEMTGVGTYDGNDMPANLSGGYLYMHGPNADELFRVVRPVLESGRFTQNSAVRLRYGPLQDGVREKKLILVSRASVAQL